MYICKAYSVAVRDIIFGTSIQMLDVPLKDAIPVFVNTIFTSMCRKGEG